MAGIETFITFIIYLLFLMGIGVYFYTKTNTHEDYVLGGRGVGYWVTAMSAQASDMSGWLLTSWSSLSKWIDRNLGHHWISCRNLC